MAKDRKIDMVILGLLSHDNLTGYDIKKQIDGSIRFFWKGSFGNIYPASREQMERTIQAEKDDELKKAFGEMLEGCITHPDQWDWYAMWLIEKTDGTLIGDLCFKGLEEKNPEIGYGILDEFQGHGYATEAVTLAVEWAFGHPEIIAIEAETDPENAASQKVLKKCGFEATGEIGEEGPRFIRRG